MHLDIVGVGLGTAFFEQLRPAAGLEEGEVFLDDGWALRHAVVLLHHLVQPDG